MKPKVLIFGGSGMLGRVFFEAQKNKYEIVPLARSDADITVFPTVLNQISIHEPDIILNFAAFTDVTSAEWIGKMEVFETNALGAQNVAKAASAFGIPLIFLSTDYIFDGENENGYLPTDTQNPVNNYGMSKYLGEELSKREYAEAIIVRTSSLYGWLLFGNPWAHKHFINRLIEQSQKWEKLRVVADSYTIPTSCIDLSISLMNLIDQIENHLWSTFHFVNETSTDELVSWYHFALEIGKYASIEKIESIRTAEYQTRVNRPKHAILNNTSNIHLPDWKTALRTYFESV
jgi:dTDP-4-dehydrorhamnose reductase